MKKLCIIAVLVTFLCTGCLKVNVLASEMRPRPQASTIKSAVHKIVCQRIDDGKLLGWGSSVNIQHTIGRPLIILTAAHIAEEGVCYKKGGVLLLRVKNHYTSIKFMAKARNGVDLALMRTHLPVLTKQPVIPLASTQGQEGDKVFTAGFPCCTGYFMLEGGTLANLKVLSSIDSKYYLFLSSPIAPGSSGGPALNSNFEIIGINVQMEQTLFGDPVYHAFSVPLHEIKDFLKENNVSY